jgi:uncharacterized membrane protein
MSIQDSIKAAAGEYLQSTDGKPQPTVNVGDPERLASIVGGAALVLVGLERRSLGGLIVAALGGMAIHRGYTGSCALYKAMQVTSATTPPPAGSDPPIATGGVVGDTTTDN